ncbi:MAG: hypothetical protein GX584_11350, partial [Clostridiaceae bacterium]|nr:hypothetical protein [Clostridiaceae bacterium]
DSDEDEEEQVIVIVNGKEENAGTETKGEENGKTSVTVSVLPETIDNKIEEALSEKTDNTQNVVQIPVKDKTSEKVNVALTGDIVKKLEDNEFHISVSRDSVQYNIPAKEITITAVAEELNVSSSSLRDIQVEIQIINVDEEIQQKYKEMVEENNSEIIFPPTEFNIVAKVSKLDGNNESVNVSKFNNYVERVIEIPEGIDPSSITTGIVFNADGTYSHVPTVVFESSGKWYAKINSLTNSTYSVIENSIKVSAVKGHWSEESVNDMASRLVILDVDTFKPDEAITRADFALYIVRALGLYRTESSELQSYCFTDVDKSDPAFIGISIACSYGLIKGYPDGTFKPQATITRQEAMTMYARAMDIVKLTIIKNDKINSYTDSKEVAAWAYDSVQKTISSGIFNGRSKTIIAPEGIFTYAEAAKAIRNILINSGLING